MINRHTSDRGAVAALLWARRKASESLGCGIYVAVVAQRVGARLSVASVAVDRSAAAGVPTRTDCMWAEEKPSNLRVFGKFCAAWGPNERGNSPGNSWPRICYLSWLESAPRAL